MAEVNRADQKLIAAIKKDDASSAKRLLDEGASSNARDAYGLTALMWAARKGHTGAIALLSERGASIDLVDRTGRTALHHAVGFQQAAVVAVLASLGCGLDCRDMHGFTALDLAKSSDDYNSARALLAAGATGDPPDPGDFSIGFTRDTRELPIVAELHRAQKFVAANRSSNPWCERAHLNVVFYVDGAFGPLEFDGIKVGKLSLAKRTLVVAAAVSDSAMTYEAARKFLIETLAAATVAAGIASPKHDCRFRPNRSER